MKIDPNDYKRTMAAMGTGQSFKVPHVNCSDSKALSITMGVEGYMFHCFKCEESYFLRHEDSTFRARKKREAEKAAFKEEEAREGFALPSDFSHYIPKAGLAWLASGGWTPDMVFKYQVGWSSRLSRVVFQIRPKGYTARAVFEDQSPKYLAKGPRHIPLYWASEPIEGRVCLVEDILSAGNVGRLYPAMAGLGTSGWNMEAILRCKEVLIWTDPDAAGEHGRQRLHSILDWMPDIRTLDIRSARDPKCYSLEKVQRILTIGGANV